MSNVIAASRLHEVENFVTVYRFFSRAVGNPNNMAERIFMMMVSLLLPHGSEAVIIVDDTLNKHCRKRVCGAGWQHEGSAPKQSKKEACGLCFVVVGLAVCLPGVSAGSSIYPSPSV